MHPGIIAAAVGGAGALGAGAVYPNSPMFGRVVGRGPRTEPALYLTFDDGPNPSATATILEVLALEAVPAAFFVVGRHLEAFPRLSRDLAESTHEIGNHSLRHQCLLWRSPGAVAHAIEAAHERIRTLCGRTPRTFRAPYGIRHPVVPSVTRRLAYTTFGWSIMAWDWRRPGVEAIRRRVRERLHPGGIILLHDGVGEDVRGDRSQTAAALAGIIRDARDGGYEFRPLSDLCRPTPA
jgi:peptidoglycan/xylan/chitin deacetylase (PgdA/CDA1 family)